MSGGLGGVLKGQRLVILRMPSIRFAIVNVITNMIEMIPTKPAQAHIWKDDVLLLRDGKNSLRSVRCRASPVQSLGITYHN